MRPTIYVEAFVVAFNIVQIAVLELHELRQLGLGKIGRNPRPAKAFLQLIWKTRRA